MSDKIAEIRERWAEFESLEHQSQVWDAHLYMRRAHNDRATLLAEVDRQRAEIKRLREEMQGAKADAWDDGYEAHRQMIDGIARKPSNPYR